MHETPVMITLEYDGAAYHGWQRQPGQRTVQGDLEEALATVLRTPVTVHGQGRTDRGVHAEGQVAHVNLPPDGLDLTDLGKRLNGILGPTCAVRELAFAPDGFHARYSAIERRYRYQIIRRYSPLRRASWWFVEDDLDLDAMRQAMAASLGEHDFGMFCSHSRSMEHTRCTLSAFSADLESVYLVIRVAGNRFLHNMVRRLVGEMVLLGRERRTVEEYLDRLDRPGPGEAGLTAPSHALILEEVVYPDQEPSPEEL